MNRPLIVHACWLVVSMLALGSGWMLKSKSGTLGPDSSRDAATPGKSTRYSASSPARRSATGETGITSRRGDARDAASGGSGSARPLSSVEIEKLGHTFQHDLDPIARRLAFAKLLEGLTVENAQEMRAQIADMPAESAEFIEFHYAWGKIGGSEAIMNGAETPKRDMAATLAGWASANPDAARAWFASLENDGKGKHATQEHLKLGMVHGLGDADPDLAAAFVLNLAAAGDKHAEKIFGIVTDKVLRSGTPEEAAAWAEHLPEGTIRTSAMARVARDFVGSDPEAAAQWASGYGDQPEGSRIVSEVGSRWAQKDPESAVTWLESLDSSAGQLHGLGSAFSAWAGRNPEVAGNYITRMPPSPERDSAISGFATRVVYEDPATAIEWADAVRDPVQREKTLVRTGQIFLRRDPNAAREWLPNSGLSPEAQQRVMNPPKDKR